MMGVGESINMNAIIWGLWHCLKIIISLYFFRCPRPYSLLYKIFSYKNKKQIIIIKITASLINSTYVYQILVTAYFDIGIV